MQKFIKQLEQFIDRSRIIDDPLLCYTYGTDASLYRMTPKLVIFAETPQEVKRLLNLANHEKIPLTFRAAGTSLSGQAVTNSILVVLSNNSWQNYTIYSDGEQISLEPGVIGAMANLYLKPYNTKIGPDPASINSCKIGGIAANNSSGMCCGTTQNTYKTLKNIKLTFANGATLDTADENSKTKFCLENPHIISGIKEIHQTIQENTLLKEQIANKFTIKNTSGYSLNSFIDYQDPIDILAHLMIGSEGTLGFINEITLNTVPNNPFKAVSLIYCKNLEDIIKLTLDIQYINIDAIELLDISSLLAIKTIEKHAEFLPHHLDTDTAAILIEISDSSFDNLQIKTSKIQEIINKHNTYYQIPFTTDEKLSQQLWDIRKGIFPIIGANRLVNTSCIIEDIAVKMIDLPSLIKELRQLFIKYNYSNSAIFGHILAGNIHFVFTPSFNSQSEIENYDKFMQDIAKLVIKHNGSLKAEHGCGRNMSAFIELEWGKTAYKLMWDIKKLLDHNNILNPDVILSHDPQIHLKNLKELQSTHTIIDKCIECGFCEVACPSRKLTFSPRQRISSYRYIQQIKSISNSLYKKLAKTYKYYGIDTCATTGLCATQCPVGIDTGKFILELKQRPETLLNRIFAKHFNIFITLNRKLITLANLSASILGKKNTYKLSRKIHQHIPIFPIYPTSLPKTQNVEFTNSKTAQEKIVYIPSCNNRIFADSSNNNSYNSIHLLLEYLGYEIIYPNELNKLCCGQMFDSSGNSDLGQIKRDEILKIIENNIHPILIDNSSCFYNLFSHSKNTKLVNIIDIIYKNLYNLKISPKYNKLALHIDCSSKKIGNQEQILKILKLCAHEIVIPNGINCCGFAGSTGFITPELNESALSCLNTQIKDCEIGTTFNRNCQIGLSLHGQKEYISIAEIVLNCLEK